MVGSCEFESRSGEVYSIQRYVIKFVTCDRFSPSPPVSSTNKTDLHDITEILLKVALNTITLSLLDVRKDGGNHLVSSSFQTSVEFQILFVVLNSTAHKCLRIY